jgi:Lecithin:cholesterol acyltransferase
MSAQRKLPLHHLVIVVPGIGGSTLKDEDGRTRWGGGLLRFAATALIPDALHLATNPHLTPTGLLSVASDLPGLTTIHPYNDLVKQLKDSFDNVVYDAGDPTRVNLVANVVAFPYDFRRSIVETAQRLEVDVGRRLKALTTSGTVPRVIVIGHSMGGLVARYWLSTLRGWPVCDALVTLGTPHRGAPKAADWLVNGVKVKGFTLEAATDVIRSWPSVYELLPRYRAVMVTGSADHTANGAHYPWEIGHPQLGALAKTAFKTHTGIETDWAKVQTGDGGVSVRPIYGHGHTTLQSLHLRRSVLTATTDAPSWLPDPGFDGDGTVPQLSAIPIELADVEAQWADATDRHGALGNAAGVVEFVKSVTGPSTGNVRGGGREERPTIGTDVEPTMLADEGLHVAVEMLDYDDDIDRNCWSATLERVDQQSGARAPTATTVVVDANRAVVTSDTLEPGLYELRLGATLDVKAQPRDVCEFIVVVEPV